MINDTLTYRHGKNSLTDSTIAESWKNISSNLTWVRLDMIQSITFEIHGMYIHLCAGAASMSSETGTTG